MQYSREIEQACRNAASVKDDFHSLKKSDMAILDSIQHLETKLTQQKDSVLAEVTKRNQLLQAQMFNLQKQLKVDETIGADKDYKTL